MKNIKQMKRPTSTNIEKVLKKTTVLNQTNVLDVNVILCSLQSPICNRSRLDLYKLIQQYTCVSKFTAFIAFLLYLNDIMCAF